MHRRDALSPHDQVGNRPEVGNDYIDATLAAAFVCVVIATVVYGVISIRKALGTPQPTAIEIGFGGAVTGGGHA